MKGTKKGHAAGKKDTRQSETVFKIIHALRDTLHITLLLMIRSFSELSLQLNKLRGHERVSHVGVGKKRRTLIFSHSPW